MSVIYTCSQKDIICPSGYYQSANGPMLTHVLGHMMYGAIGGLVITGRAHCLSFWLHVYTYIHTYIHTHIHTYIHTYRQTDRQTDILSKGGKVNKNALFYRLPSPKQGFCNCRFVKVTMTFCYHQTVKG